MRIKRAHLVLRDNGTPPEDGGGSGNPLSPPPPPAPPASSVKTFTQDELDRIVGQAKAEAKRSSTKDLLAELNLEKVDDLRAAIKQVKDAEKANMTEAERLRTEAAEAKAEADRLRAEAATERHSLSVERALATAGAKPERLSRLARLVDVEVGADTAAILAAVEAVKSDFPEAFKGATTPPPSEPANGGKPAATPPGTDPLSKGGDLAKAWKAGKRGGFFK